MTALPEIFSKPIYHDDRLGDLLLPQPQAAQLSVAPPAIIVYMVRHGETEFNKGSGAGKDRIRGWKDVPLNQEGIKEAQRLGHAFAGQKIGRLFTSDLSRAQHTAEAIAKTTGAQLEATWRLRPWNLGKYQGQESAKVHPLLAELIRKEPDHVVEGGESFTSFKSRGIGAVRQILALAERKQQHMVVVSHFRNCKLVEAWLIGGVGAKDDVIDVDVFLRNDLPTGSAIELRSLGNGNWKARRVQIGGTEGPTQFAVEAAFQPGQVIAPDKDISAHARSYMKQAGLDYDESPMRYDANVDKPGAKLAEHYEHEKHDPNNPEVKKAYDAFKRETLAQFRHLQKQGYQFEPSKGEPYGGDAGKTVDDVRRHKHLNVYVGSDDMPKDHPLAEQTGVVLGGHNFTYNDAFRAVHDVFGHSHYGSHFGPVGENQAYRAHARMYSAAARPAMANETKGQNSWLHFGPHRMLTPAERPFAEQKANIIKMAHAPKGGVTIAGQTFTGGEFIPTDVLAQATDAERQQLEQPPVDAAPTGYYQMAPELKAKVARAAPGHGRQLNLTKDEIHAVLSAGIVGFVSAGRNNNSVTDQALTDAQIAARHEQLQQRLVALGCKFVPVHGKYGSEEDSFLVMVPDVSRHEVVALGQEFNQDSVIYSERGRNEMIFTTGDNVGQAIVGRGWEPMPDADDFYSELTTKDGQKFKFQLHFDFEAMVKLSRRLSQALAAPPAPTTPSPPPAAPAAKPKAQMDVGPGPDTLDKSKPLTLMMAGSFAPVHRGHVKMADDAKKYFEGQGYKVGRVAFAPTSDGLMGNKLGKAALSLQDRSNMLRAALADHPGYEVADEPAKLFDAAHKSSLHEWASHKADWADDRYPDSQVVSLVGTDDAHVPVADKPVAYTMHGTHHYLAMPRPQSGEFGISSSAVRQALKSGGDTSKLLPPGVAEYLHSKLPDYVKQLSLCSDWQLSLRAPEGYTHEHPLMVGGKAYIGGEFVPDEEVDKLGPVQKMFLNAEIEQHNAKREYDLKKQADQAAKEAAAVAKMPPPQLADAQPRNDNIYPPDNELPPGLMAWTTDITVKHREAMSQYSGEAGMSFNGPLHDLHGPLTHDWSSGAEGGMAAYYDNITKDIHFAIAEAPPLPRPLTVWRGVQLADDADAAKMRAEFEESLKNGTPVHTTGFLSTTLKPSMALEYAKKTNAEGKMHGAPDAKMSGNSFLLEINAKHGIYLDGQSEHPEERELVMDHWCQFKVTGIKQLTVNGEAVQVYQLDHVLEQPK